MFEFFDCPVCHKKTKYEVDKILYFEKLHRNLTAIMHCTECSTSHTVDSYDQYSPPSRK